MPIVGEISPSMEGLLPGAPPRVALYFPPKHIACYNHSTLMTDIDVAFYVEAVGKQIREHIAPLWDKEPPGIAFYGHAERIPVEEAAILGGVDDDGNAESAGYHTNILGRVYGLVDARQSRIPSVTWSHEAGEMYANANLDRKVPGPKNRSLYIEIFDPTQAQSYEIEVTLFGETRKVLVGDFVLPAWYQLPNPYGAGPRTTYLDQPLNPFEIAPGGYQIAEESDGEIVFLSQGEARLNRSGHSRTGRIIKRR